MLIEWDILTSHGSVIMAIDILRRVIVGNFFGASWFLVALITGVPIIFYLSQRLSNKNLLIITLLINILTVIQCGYGRGCGAIVLMFRSFMSQIVGTSLEFTFFVALFWISVGKYLSETKLTFDKLYLLLGIITCSIGLFFENYYIDKFKLAYRHDLYLTLIPLCILIILYIGRSKFYVSNEIAKVLRKLSTIVYCVHFTLKDLILYYTNHLLGEQITHIILFILTYSISVSIGLLIISYASKHNNSILRYSY